jgi:hypothetical protein
MQDLGMKNINEGLNTGGLGSTYWNYEQKNIPLRVSILKN